jgi:hypothetical protein
MNTDFRSLEKRYGTLIATDIFREIARVEQRHFSFYRIPEAMRALQEVDGDDELESDDLIKNSKAA